MSRGQAVRQRFLCRRVISATRFWGRCFFSCQQVAKNASRKIFLMSQGEFCPSKMKVQGRLIRGRESLRLKRGFPRSWEAHGNSGLTAGTLADSFFHIAFRRIIRGGNS